MKVLVTGATGFLGHFVVESLLERGCDVVAVTRRGVSSRPWLQSDRVEIREADLRTDPLDSLVEGVDSVVHLAAQVTGNDEARFAGTVMTTERLLDALSRTPVKRLVLISSYSVYDWEAAAERLEESSLLLDRPYARDGYAVAKLWQERLVDEFIAKTPAQVTIVRPGFIWGIGREAVAGAGVRLGPILLVVGPRMRLPLTFVSNCADFIAEAVTSPEAAGAVFNVVDGNGVRAWRYGRFLASLDQGIKVRVPIPYAVGRAFVGLVAAVMPRIFERGGKLPGVLVTPSFVARFRPLRHSSGRAEKVLGWTPRTEFDSAAAQCIAAAREDRDR